MNSPFALFSFVALASLACSAAAFADGSAASGAEQLVLNNGDHLTGKVTKRENGKIYFHSDVLGDIVVPANLATVADNPTTATTAESLAGLPPQPAVKTLKPPPAGTAPLLIAPTTGAGAPAAPPPGPPRAAAVSQPAYRHARPIVAVPVINPWTGKVEFGYDNESTNVRTVQTTLRAEAERSAGPDDFVAQGHYLYGLSDHQPTSDQEEAEFRWRHNLDERLFTQALTSYTSDKIRSIHDDIDENLGLGYKVYKGVRQTVDVGFGVIGQYLDVAGIQEGFDTLGSVFQDYTYKINGRYTFLEDAAAEYSPQDRARFGLSNGQVGVFNGRTHNYDYKFHATLQGKITERLSLNLHFEYQYYSAVFEPDARADERITTTLGFAF